MRDKSNQNNRCVLWDKSLFQPLMQPYQGSFVCFLPRLAHLMTILLQHTDPHQVDKQPRNFSAKYTLVAYLLDVDNLTPVHHDRVIEALPLYYLIPMATDPGQLVFQDLTFDNQEPCRLCRVTCHTTPLITLLSAQHSTFNPPQHKKTRLHKYI